MHAKYVNGGGESKLIDVYVSMRDHHDYYSLHLKKKKHVIHPMQINIEKETYIMLKIQTKYNILFSYKLNY